VSAAFASDCVFLCMYLCVSVCVCAVCLMLSVPESDDTLNNSDSFNELRSAHGGMLSILKYV